MLLEIVDQAYEKKAWHGTNLRGSVRGLTAKEAAWRPAEREVAAEFLAHGRALRAEHAAAAREGRAARVAG